MAPPTDTTDALPPTAPDRQPPRAAEASARRAPAGETGVAEAARGTGAGDAAASAATAGSAAAGGVARDASASDGAPLVVRTVHVAAVRRSPFQPRGRPSAAAVGAVQRGIAEAGSLRALVGPEGTAIFARLDAEAARLAELAFDIAENGIKTPVEVRTAEDGSDECLAGHRRLAAAALAGLEEVPALHRGTMSSAAAAATVLRGNLHRENFTTWQEAVLVTEVQERRRADGYRDNVRSLGTVMGWSHGKVNMLLRIRKALSPAFLERVGNGDAGRVEEALARAPYRDLERLASEPDEERRAVAARRLLGWTTPSMTTVHDRPVCAHRPKRGGGFVIEVHAPVESLPAGDAALLREYLESQLTRVRARLQSLGHG